MGAVGGDHFYFVVHQVGREFTGRSSAVYQSPADPVVFSGCVYPKKISHVLSYLPVIFMHSQNLPVPVLQRNNSGNTYFPYIVSVFSLARISLLYQVFTRQISGPYLHFKAQKKKPLHHIRATTSLFFCQPSTFSNISPNVIEIFGKPFNVTTVSAL